MKFTSLFALLGIAQAGIHDAPPPTTGRFFYTDMRSETGEHKEGTHVIETLISSSKKHFNLGLNTQRYSLSVVSDKCPTSQCQVPNVYFPGESKSLRKSDNGDNLDNSAYINTNHNLINTNLQAEAVQDTVMLQIDQYDREIRSDFVFESIWDSSERYSDNYDGFIGIAPPQQHRALKNANFLQQLQDKHFIDHQVVMINSNVKEGNSSIVKFGSWDPSALAPGAHLTTLRTRDSKNWVLKSQEIRLAGRSFLSGVNKDIDVSPHLPYLYMPDAEWSHFAYTLNDMFGSQIQCEWDANYCRFQGSCNKYVNGRLPFEIEIQDEAGGGYAFDVNLNKYLVDGDNFGLKTGKYCYIPVFRSYHLKLQNTWFLGSIFMDDYVFVFDNTPYTEKEQDFMTISIGLKNKDATQREVEKQYNKTSPLYAPSDEDTTTNSTLNFTADVIPVKDVEAPVEPVEITPITTDSTKEKTIKKDTSSDVTPIDKEFVDATPPAINESNPPSPGFSLAYIYYLWTQVTNISSFFTSGFGMIMSVYHKILG